MKRDINSLTFQIFVITFIIFNPPKFFKNQLNKPFCLECLLIISNLSTFLVLLSFKAFNTKEVIKTKNKPSR